MATLNFSRRHNQSTAEASRRVRSVIEDFQSRYSSHLNRISWADDETWATAEGKRFRARFDVDDDNVVVHVELIGMMARVLKSKVESKIIEKLDEHFPE